MTLFEIFVTAVVVANLFLGAGLFKDDLKRIIEKIKEGR